MVKSTLAASVMFAFPQFFFSSMERYLKLRTCPFIVLLDSVMFYNKYMNNYVCLYVSMYVFLYSMYDLCWNVLCAIAFCVQ